MKRVENLSLIKGETDYIREARASKDGGEIVVTIVGFKTGQGVILVGIYLGLREGKKVKIYLDNEMTTYRGSPVFSSVKIEGAVALCESWTANYTILNKKMDLPFFSF